MDESYVIPVGYAEFAPPSDLASWVACFWTSLSPATVDVDAVHRVLPDGCVDIILGFGRAGDSGDDLSEAMGVGSMTRPMFVRGNVARLYIGVRFKPGCAYAALGMPAGELTDQQVAFDLLGRDASAELEQIAKGASNEARLDALVQLVRRRMLTAAIVPGSVRAAVRRIVSAHGNLRIASLASDIGITRQQLARHFSTHVGVTPKMLARVMRAHEILARFDAARAAYPRNDVDWSAIAYELGYYDQPHFIDDFKSLTGSTPSSWPAPKP